MFCWYIFAQVTTDHKFLGGHSKNAHLSVLRVSFTQQFPRAIDHHYTKLPAQYCQLGYNVFSWLDKIISQAHVLFCRATQYVHVPVALANILFTLNQTTPLT